METKTVKELRGLAGELGIVGRWTMKKDELIEAINNAKAEPKEKETIDYLKNAEVGTIVAFTRGANKQVAMSGKLISFDGNKVVVESKMGTVFELAPENIVWVKTGTRWPRWVFSLFNKKEESEVE